MAGYDTIILGFPIWWHTAPMPVLSFLNYYDLNGKTIYTFCTSGESPVSESTADVRSNAVGATVVEGRRFTSGNDGRIKSWLDGLGLTANIGGGDGGDDDGNDSNNGTTVDGENGKILIAYFSWSGTTTNIVDRRSPPPMCTG